MPARNAARPRPRSRALSSYACDVIEGRLDAMEDDGAFTTDEIEQLWCAVLRERAPQVAESRFILPGKVRDKLGHVLEVVGRRGESPVPASTWRRLLGLVAAVPLETRKQVVLPRSVWLTLSELYRQAKDRRDFVFGYKQWQFLLENVLPERYLGPPAPPLPAVAEPGTPRKVEVMAQRRLRQLCLWHPLDVKDRPQWCAALCELMAAKKGRRQRRRRPRHPAEEGDAGLFRLDDEDCDGFADEVARAEHERCGGVREDGTAMAGVLRGREYNVGEHKKCYETKEESEAGLNARRVRDHAAR